MLEGILNIDKLPTLDLHGESIDISKIFINDFINDNLKLGKKKIVVVHGIGEGILKEELRLLFKNDKRVKTMYTPASNIGCTIIELF